MSSAGRREANVATPEATPPRGRRKHVSGTFGSVPTQIARRDTGLNGDAGARLAKTSRLNLRVAPADDALLRQAAELLGETMYVAATRAWDELVVTWESEGSEFLHSSLVREP